MLDLLKVIYTHTTKVTLWYLLLSDFGAMTPDLGLVALSLLSGVRYPKSSLPDQVVTGIASYLISDVFHVRSCCCKGVAGRMVCWQFRQAITRDHPHANHPKFVVVRGLGSINISSAF